MQSAKGNDFVKLDVFAIKCSTPKSLCVSKGFGAFLFVIGQLSVRV
jgi:hypothetical protein